MGKDSPYPNRSHRKLNVFPTVVILAYSADRLGAPTNLSDRRMVATVALAVLAVDCHDCLLVFIEH